MADSNIGAVSAADAIEDIAYVFAVKCISVFKELVCDIVLLKLPVRIILVVRSEVVLQTDDEDAVKLKSVERFADITVEIDIAP